ncbi:MULTISPECIES: hypothetical protein [Cohnella]|uniref:hypothetical protein n=1 Tax=Cohnella TaxID=329857 RepID=UPI00036DBEA1|nr:MULTISPECIES: hypothetical protein [Cohnella]REK66104.1 MAG: hypothetical protein C6P35_08770 [Cohnella sp.]
MKKRDGNEANFVRWADRAERRLLQVAAGLAAALIAAQLLLQIPAVRHVLSGAESREGIVYHAR